MSPLLAAALGVLRKIGSKRQSLASGRMTIEQAAELTGGGERSGAQGGQVCHH